MKQQRGSTLIGFIIGVVVGLAAALIVAMYVAKVPAPFVNKSQTRSAEKDAIETQKNQGWDPNASLYGKNPAPAVPQASTALPPANAASAPAVKPEPKADTQQDTKTDSTTAPKTDAKTNPTPSTDPLGDLLKAKTNDAAKEGFVYWVQVGAFRTAEDAESHRAKLSLGGVESKISEREQSGQVVYRVRVGPFDKKEDGERAKEKLDKAGMETALVRVKG
jgi:cell division protein FtsN